MPFEANIAPIPTGEAMNTGLPATEFPSLQRIATTDLVGPLAANRQEAALERRDNTLRDRVNRLINNINLVNSLYLPRSEADAIILQLITDYGIRRDGGSAACTGEILLAPVEDIVSPAAAVRLDMAVTKQAPGIQTIISKLASAPTEGADGPNTLVTKGWLESSLGGLPNQYALVSYSGAATVWSKPEGVGTVYAILIGGGGAGGGSAPHGSVGPWKGGDGADGGATQVVMSFDPAAEDIPISIGGGGVKGTRSTGIDGGAGGGGGGGATTFGSVAVAAAGGGGGGSGSTGTYGDGGENGGAGGAGGVAGSNGDYTGHGHGGAAGFGGTASGGAGGAERGGEGSGYPGSVGLTDLAGGTWHPLSPPQVPATLGKGGPGGAAPLAPGDPGSDGTNGTNGCALLMWRE